MHLLRFYFKNLVFYGMKNSILILFLFVTFGLQAQDSALSLERIYSANEFSSQRAKSLRWHNGGDSYTTLESSTAIKGGMDIVSNNTKSGKQTILVPAKWLIPTGEEKPIPLSNYSWSDDHKKVLLFTNTQRVWRYHTKGDYYVLNLTTKELTKLGGQYAEPSTLMFAKFSPDGNRVAYVREHNVYVESLNDQSIIQLTNDGSKDIINGTFDWAYEEEFACRDGFKWSPDGSKIAYWRIDASSIRNFLMINNTDDVYSHTIPVQYPKAGEKPSEAKIGIVSTSGGTTTWMQFDGDASNQYLPRMIWNPNSQSILVQLMNRAQNHNRVMSCNARDGAVTQVYEDRETAWLEAVDDFEYSIEGSSFTWVSEKSGWKSCYYINSGNEKLISPASSDMMSIQLLDEPNGWLYYMASPENATQKYLYRISLNDQTKIELLSPADQPGQHRYDISPNGKFAKHSYSAAGLPTISEIVSLPKHKTIRTLVANKDLKKKVAALERNPVEFFKIPVSDDVYLDAYMIKPINFNSNKKYPVLFHVYGEPWGQTVQDAWGGSTYLWHLMLAQQGYLIMSIDNRGTPAPKGREWRKCVYGQIGVLSSDDQALGAQYIMNTYPFVDKDRIGIWGWSGGGSMTLNMLFRYPNIYHTGMSVAPVANQLLYDNIYQERYSGVPQEMPESYEKGSPVNFAKNLKGNLLVVHGTGDDNVHYQNTEVLVNELIKHNKIFSMMAYPNRSHGIREGENTSRHVREILTHYLHQNMPAGGK